MCEIVGEGHNGPHTSNDAARKPQIIFSYVCIAIFGLLSVKHFDTVTSGTPLRNCGIQLNGESKLFSDFSKYRLNSLFNRDCVYSDRQAATMAVEKGDRQLVVTVDKQNVCDADTQAAIPHSVPSAQFCDTQLPALTRRQRVLRGIAHHLHIATFLPLVLISALRSIDIMVAAVVCTTVVLCILFLSFCAYKAGYVQVGRGCHQQLHTNMMHLQ